MGWLEIVFGSLLVVVLLAVAAYFIRSQWRTLRQLANDASSARDELIFHRRQAYRRLVASVLILVLGLMLAVLLIFLEGPAQALADRQDAFPDQANRPELPEEDRPFARFYGWYWIVFLVLLLVLLVVGAWDYLALRRFGRVQRKRIHDDRKAMIAREANRIREERNGEAR